MAVGASPLAAPVIDVFLSYARSDRRRAEKIAAGLRDRGWVVWWDHQLLGGSDFRKAIGTRLASARAVVVLWSDRSRDSKFVVDEAKVGLDRGVLIPVHLESGEDPLGFRSLHWVDATNWTGDFHDASFEELVRSIEAMLGGTPTTTVPDEAMRVAARRRQSRLAKASLAAAVAVALPIPLLGSLAMQRARTTAVLVDVVASEAHFRTGNATLFNTARPPVRSLGASWIRGVTIPGSNGTPRDHVTDRVRLSLARPGPVDGALSFSPIELPESASVSISSGRASPTISMDINGSVASVHAFVDGAVRIEIPDLPDTVESFSDGSITLHPNQGLHLDLAFATDSMPLLIVDAIPASRIELWSEERENGAVVTANRFVSTVVDGRMTFPELDREPEPLSAGSLVRLSGVQGHIRNLRASSGQMSFTFDGRVDSVGIKEDLTPSRLEDLVARRTVIAALAAAIYLVLATIGVVRIARRHK
jgi:hypothetical protein